MKKPTTLYYHDSDFDIKKHKITKECCPQLVYRWNDVGVDGYRYKDTYWRCTCSQGDFHGHDNLKSAKDYLADCLQSYICTLQGKLKKLKDL
jgi:hypothetical protein